MQAGPETAAPTGGGGANPFLAPPDPEKAAEYKRGYMMRKCCLDPGGKRSESPPFVAACAVGMLVIFLTADVLRNAINRKF